jgi:DNA-directed RNA polymerase specialized sigma subunit
MASMSININSKYLSATETYERFFSDSYKTYASYYCAVIRHQKIPFSRVDKNIYFNENDVKQYFANKNLITQKRTYWITILTSVKEHKKINEVQKLIHMKNPTILYEVISKNKIGEKIIKKLEAKEKEILSLVPFDEAKKHQCNNLPQDVKTMKNYIQKNPYGMTHQEIADKLGLTRAKVWHFEDSALKKIRKIIIDQGLSSNLLEYFCF